MDPVWILLSPTLAKANARADSFLRRVESLEISQRSARPGDLSPGPGRDDGGEGMPVEESGNMILLCDAIAQADGDADFASHWWPQLSQWRTIWKITDSIRKISSAPTISWGIWRTTPTYRSRPFSPLPLMAIFAKCAADSAGAQRYKSLAKADAQHWMHVASDSDHYRLAFDKPDTWSQKYNLVWDRILGLNIFPPVGCPGGSCLLPESRAALRHAPGFGARI